MPAFFQELYLITSFAIRLITIALYFLSNIEKVCILAQPDFGDLPLQSRLPSLLGVVSAHERKLTQRVLEGSIHGVIEQGI
jgi:hypothetical protein